MDAIWRALENLLRFLSAHASPFVAAIGLGLVRTVFGWLLGMGAIPIASLDWHLLVDLGEIAVFVVFAALVARRGPLCRRSLPVLLGFAALLAALALGAARLHCPLPWILGAAGNICSGIAYAVLLLIWLEACGCMTPTQAVLAISGSYVVSLLGWFLLNPMDLASGRILVVVLAMTAVGLLVAAYCLIPHDAIPLARPAGAAGVPHTRTVVSVRMLAWVALVSFVYGLGDSFTQLGFSTIASKVGMALPFVAIAAGAHWARDRLDLRMLYRASLALIGVGVLPALLLGSLHNTAQVLMSAAQASTSIVACAFACTSARRRHESAIFGCAILLAIALAATLLGNAAGTAFIDVGFELSVPMARVTGVAVVVAAVALAALLMHDEDLSSLVMDARDTQTYFASGDTLAGFLAHADQEAEKTGDVRVPRGSASPSGTGEADKPLAERLDVRSIMGKVGTDEALRAAALDRLASEAHLSKREAVVFSLMAQGGSIVQISDELFIAQGTVRAHMSRIYEKLGVHSREEFTRLMRADEATRPI